MATKKQSCIDFLKWYTNSGLTSYGSQTINGEFWVNESDYEWFGEDERKLSAEQVYELYLKSKRPESKVPNGYIPVSEFCKINGISKQTVYKYKHKYHWFVLSHAKRYIFYVGQGSPSQPKPVM